MGEVVTLSIGQYGNRIGSRFFEIISKEHGLDFAGKQVSDSNELAARRPVFFEETSDYNYEPRTLLVDLETNALDSIRSGACGRLFSSDKYVFDQCGSGNLFPRGYYKEGADLAVTVIDRTRRLLESCDRPQGFQINHSVSGGTGSGLGSLVMSKLREEFTESMMTTYSLFPKSVSDIVIECYNTAFALDQLVESVDFVAVCDNDALLRVAQEKLGVASPTIADMNHLVASTMSGVTSCMRFRGLVNSSLRKIAVNLIPFPRLHFFAMTQVPFAIGSVKSQSRTAPELIESLFDLTNFLNTRYEPRFHMEFTGLTGAAMFRGDISSYEVESGLANSPARSAAYFVEWMEDQLFSSLCPVPGLDFPVSASLLLNSDVAMRSLVVMCEKFTSMFRRKAFMHWYTAEGMTEMDFTEAESHANDLVSEYYMLRGCQCYSEEDYEEDN